MEERDNQREKELELIKEYLQEDNTSQLKQLLSESRPEDLAELFPALEREEQLSLIDLLDEEDAGTLLDELDSALQEDIVEQLSQERLGQIIQKMPPDEATDLLEILPEEEVSLILESIAEEKSTPIRELLTYPEDTAGGRMTTNIIRVYEDNTVEEAINYLREKGETEEPFFYIYVTDKQNRLVGIVNLKKLVTAQSEVKIKQIMEEEEVISVTTNTPQEEVASLVSKYDLMAIPVINRRRKLLGGVTVDDIMDVIEEEVNEDVYKMAATKDEELANLSPFSKARIRLPWLITCLMGTLVSASILHFFKDTLSQKVVLTLFIPAIMAMGGNSGLQSLTITVRSMTTGVLDRYSIAKVILRELSTAMLLGIIFGALMGVISGIWIHKHTLGFIVGISMFLAISLSSLTGIFVPLLFRKIGIDPAIASGPLITTLNDITAIFVYLGLATLLIHLLS